ncbi:MAG: type 1 glutamine amidotransferase [Actinobacteria bacterium]|nr:type 1 glutamine amidotransferase [Actinomycetota bacterium]
MRVAVLVAEMFEEPELLYPYYRLLEEGHQVILVGSEALEYKGKHGYPVRAEVGAGEVRADELDGVVVPGGFGPDSLRLDPNMVTLTRDLAEAGKPVAAICHGPSLLISADVLRGRRATSYAAVRDDVRNAGAQWVDEPVVVDGPIITSRVPDDLPQFVRAVLAALR